MAALLTRVRPLLLLWGVRIRPLGTYGKAEILSVTTCNSADFRQSVGFSTFRPFQLSTALAACRYALPSPRRVFSQSTVATTALPTPRSEMSSLGIRINLQLHDLTPDEIAEKTDDLIVSTKAKYDAIASIKKEDVTSDNCIVALIDLDRDYSNSEAPLYFLQYIATKKAVRDASVAASKKLNDFSVEIAMRKDIFDLIKYFTDQVGLEGLTHEQKRFVEKEIIDGERNGLHLPEDQRQEIMKVKKKISELGTTYQSNLNEDNTFLEFTEEELLGVPEDLVKSFEKMPSGKLKVTMKYPHFFPVTRKCRVPETRRLMETAYQSKCLKENTPVLEEIIQLRQKQAELLGYDNHACYVLELRMAKHPEKVAKFLKDLQERLQPLWAQEKEDMLAIKKEECEKYGFPFSGQLDFWDFRYYMTMIEETKYAVDHEKLREYFPMDKVTKGLLEIYQELLGLKFTQVPQENAWHEDVTLYQVDDKDTNKKLGFFFLDLYPREGKFGHAAVFGLQNSCGDVDGSRQVGVCAMLTNFAKPTAEKPSLLTHDEVETYFHEFGHVMHKLCSVTETSRFSGSRVERDFVEAPSQMLENWVWEEKSLKKMSGHYKDDSPIPKELLVKLIASRKANAGGFNLRQIVLSTFDQMIHTTGKADTQAVFAQVYETVMGLRPIPGTNMPASWTHMVGYDAQYYGYLWSEVFSFDMFETHFRQRGLLNPTVGQEYRTKILRPGGSKDASELLRDFLGRDPNDEAFLKAKGLSH